MGEPGWWDVAGGKLTTYRLMAEQTVDHVARAMGRSLPSSRTAQTPLAFAPWSGVLPPAVGPEVVAACCRREWAIHLDDVLVRRTSWHYYHRNRARIAEDCARWMAAELGWTAGQISAELERYYKVS